MPKCKHTDGHSFKIDTPTFFKLTKQTPEEYYQPKINAIMFGTDDWFYPRSDVFTHLVCEHCQKEEHVYLPAKYLNTVMADDTFRFGVNQIKRLQYTLPDGTKVTHDVNIGRK